MHIANETKIVLEFGGHADRSTPFLDQLQDFVLHPRISNRRSFREASHQFIEKLFCTDLKMEGVTAVLDAMIQ